MEGIVGHFLSKRNELRLKLQASEAALAEERAKAVGMAARVGIAERLSHSWEQDNMRLREDLQVLRNRITTLESKVETGRREVSGRWYFTSPRDVLLTLLESGSGGCSCYGSRCTWHVTL